MEMTTTSEKRICLGKIATAHGIRGLVKVTMYGEDPNAFDKYGPLYTSETGSNTISLKMKNSTGTHWLAEIPGITDRTAAEKLRGTELWLARDNLPQLSKGKYYHTDLIGLCVFDENRTALGTVAGVHNFGAGDLLEIQPESKPSYYVPFKKSSLIKVDLQAKEIYLTIPEEYLS